MSEPLVDLALLPFFLLSESSSSTTGFAWVETVLVTFGVLTFLAEGSATEELGTLGAGVAFLAGLGFLAY